MRVLIRKESKVPIKAWVDGVEFEQGAQNQLFNIATLPFIFKHVAVMPDCHQGIGATVGSVIPTKGAIIPAAVGVDLGCGVIAAKLNVTMSDISDNGDAQIFDKISEAVPHGRTNHGGENDKGAWGWDSPRDIGTAFNQLSDKLNEIKKKHPKIDIRNARRQLASLGGGNHFIECCNEIGTENVWIMLHSGSRGVGNQIGQYFIELAKKDMKRHFIHLPDQDLAYLSEGTEYFDDYVDAVAWAQDYALVNRELMLNHSIAALTKVFGKRVQIIDTAINCHHNYIAHENHYGSNVYVTRKGAIRARSGDLGIIPGSMGKESFIVRGKGNPESFMSCSHGAGRRMSRGEAKRTFTLKDHREATDGVFCKKDKSVIDETPGAYKDITKVMEAQADLVEVVYKLKQFVCIKG